MGKPTPGPWNIWRGPQFVGGGEDICIGAGEKWLANMDHRERRCPQIFENGHKADECDICTIDAPEISAEQLANARLIAAAPDLLDALIHMQWCRDCGESTWEDCEGGRAALAAIAKATREPTNEQ